jgi:hypothetical protein
MGKKKATKSSKKPTKKAVKLAMDCTWNEDGRTLKNKDVKPPKAKVKKSKIMSPM